MNEFTSESDASYYFESDGYFSLICMSLLRSERFEHKFHLSLDIPAENLYVFHRKKVKANDFLFFSATNFMPEVSINNFRPLCVATMSAHNNQIVFFFTRIRACFDCCYIVTLVSIEIV